ncbi:MAG: class I SAM-dependent methyltransferase [Actinobacteria bacterium]|nr:class I SAM-dependent methyltransferase [Actinomycetota bacterium]
MAHPAQLAFFADVVARFPDRFAGHVLDVGSHDVNGGPHTLIDPARYVGVDLAPGRNVDVVADGAMLAFPSGCVDVVMSSECFEHAPAWETIVAEMIRTLRPGGLIVSSAAATGRREHGTTRSDGGVGSPATVARGQEWYRNRTGRRVRRVLRRCGVRVRTVHVDRRVADVYVVGVQAPTTRADRSACRAVGQASRRRPGPNRSPRPWRQRIMLRVGGDVGLARLVTVRARVCR